MTKICAACGESIANENAIVCPNCGKPVSEEASCHYNDSSNASEKTYEKTETSYSPPDQTKSPFLAVLLSVIWVGLGQLYNGNFKRGLMFSFACTFGSLLVLPGLIIYIWGIWDAYDVSEKMNRGELPYAKPTDKELILFLCITFLVLFVLIFAILIFFYIAMILFVLLLSIPFMV